MKVSKTKERINNFRQNKDDINDSVVHLYSIKAVVVHCILYHIKWSMNTKTIINHNQS